MFSAEENKAEKGDLKQREPTGSRTFRQRGLGRPHGAVTEEDSGESRRGLQASVGAGQEGRPRERALPALSSPECTGISESSQEEHSWWGGHRGKQVGSGGPAGCGRTGFSSEKDGTALEGPGQRDLVQLRFQFSSITVAAVLKFDVNVAGEGGS